MISDADRVLESLRKNGSGRPQDIRADYKSMTISAIEAALQNLLADGKARPTKRVAKRKKDTYWEATPC